jgi:hypothetical protein
MVLVYVFIKQKHNRMSTLKTTIPTAVQPGNHHNVQELLYLAHFLQYLGCVRGKSW